MDFKLSDYIQAGTISKTHGICGRVVLKTEYNLELAEFEEPVIVISDGLPVPLFIEDIEEKSSDTYIVKFELINKPEKAKNFIGCSFLVHRIILNQEQLNFIPQLRGLKIIDSKTGLIGVCLSIEMIPGNPLMIVETKNGLVHIPIVDEWVAEFVPDKYLKINCPDGLLAL